MAQRKRQSTLELSDDAKALLGSVFQHGCELSFQLIESRPTQRCEEALRELVESQAIVKTHGQTRADGSRSVSYRARIPTETYRRFSSKSDMQMAEPMPGRTAKTAPK